MSGVKDKTGSGLHFRLPKDHRIGSILRDPVCVSAAIVCLCFLLTSTAWLAWEYHLLTLASSSFADLMTMGAGYLLQAAGIGLYSVLLRRFDQKVSRFVPLILLLLTLCLIPAILSPSLVWTLITGFALNLLCGMIAGYYLAVLSSAVASDRRGTVLGFGYSVSILCSWLLSRIGNGTLYYSSNVWLICLALTACGIALVQWEQRTLPRRILAGVPRPDHPEMPRRLLLAVGAVVLLFSIVYNSGISFFAADLLQGVNIEFSRLYYAIGLIIAGLTSDRNRKYGAVAALAALVIPFVMLSLRAEPVPVAICWALSYFAFGFHSVFRMIVFTDLAEKHRLWPLCVFGLMLGRAGDALGTTLCSAFTRTTTALIFLTALLFVCAVFAFFRIYRPMYVPESAARPSEKERFYQFAVQHDLSSREREVMRYVLEEKTNGEIAAALSISENTVKFHIRNLLQKTGCRNRNELVAAYMGHFQAE